MGKTNKITQDSGLICNVNTVKAKLKDFYEMQGIAIPMFSGGQASMTATLQKTLTMILKECSNTTGKDKSGVKLVNRESVKYAVLLHQGFNQYFLAKFNQFDPTQLYKDQVPISTSEMDEVIKSVDSDLSLTPKARNMVCYLLLKVFNDISYTCSQLLEFSKKKSLDARCVMSSIGIKFTDSVSQELKTEVVRVAKALGDDLEDTQETDKAEEPSNNTQTAAVDEADGGEEPDPKKTAKKDVKKTEEAKDTKPKDNKPKTGNKAAAKAPTIDEEEHDGEEDQGEEAPVEEIKTTKPTGKPATGNKPVTGNKPAKPQPQKTGKAGGK